MTTDPDNIVLVYLRRIDQRVADIAEDIKEIRGRVGLLEEQYASMSRRLDRMGLDIDRIKRRLDLIDEPT